MEENLLEQFLVNLDGPNIGLVKEADLTEITDLCEANNIGYFIIDGKKIQDSNELLQYLFKNLNFPDYFGFNWDALWDVMRDILLPGFLEGVNENRNCLVFSNTSPFLASEGYHLFIFISIIHDLFEYQKDEMFYKLIIEMDKEEFDKGYQRNKEMKRVRREISYLLLE